MLRRLLAAMMLFGSVAATPAMAPVMVYAEDGGSYKVPAEQGCQKHTSLYDEGKTEEGFKAHATDGCNVVDWTSNTTDVTGSGKLTFTTISPAIQPWEPGYTLPGPQGGNYCQYRAAHEANLYFGNLFKVPAGTEVTVTYNCF